MEHNIQIVKNKITQIEATKEKQELKLDNFGFQQDVLYQNAQKRTFSNKPIEKDRIDDDEMKTLVGQVPLPNFEVLSPAEEKSLKKRHAFRYREYKKQKEAYIQKIDKWKDREILRQDSYRKLLQVRREGENYPNVAPNADAMMEAYSWANQEEIKKAITKYGQDETNAFLEVAKYSGFVKAEKGITEYAQQYYIAYNDYLRKDRNVDNMTEANKSTMTAKRIRNLEQADNALKLNKMSHQLVTHRYVKADALPFMLNTKSEADAEVVLEQFSKSKDKQHIIQEKGFYSTGMYRTHMNEVCFKSDVEIFILVEKGTRAVSIADTRLQMAEEAELLLAPGTKFELVDVRKNSDYQKGDVKWRLFLKTIPQSSDGIPA